jgi:hypothetical protein
MAMLTAWLEVRPWVAAYPDQVTANRGSARGSIRSIDGYRAACTMAAPPPQLPSSPPTEWPSTTTSPPSGEPGWLVAGDPSHEREAWTAWQVAVVTVVALLAGLAIGVAVGLRLGDGNGPTSASPSFQPDAGQTTPTTRGNEIIGDHLGSPSNPVPLETTFILGGYSLSVLEVDPDGARVVTAESELNTSPLPNQAYLLVTVELTYDGPLEGNPIEVLLSAQDPSGSTYLEFRDSCGRIPMPLSRHAEIAPGESVTGNVCFAVPADRVDHMVLIAEVLAGYPVHYRLG